MEKNVHVNFQNRPFPTISSMEQISSCPFEDAIFFNEIRKSRVKTGLSGDSWIHHFGSVTQKDMKKKLGIQDDKVLIKHKDRKLLNQTWLERKLVKYNLRKAQKESRENEFNKYGMTLLADRFAGQFNWK